MKLAGPRDDEALETPAPGSRDRWPEAAGALRAAYEKSEGAGARESAGQPGQVGDAQAIHWRRPLGGECAVVGGAGGARRDRRESGDRGVLGRSGSGERGEAILGSALLACIDRGAPAARAEESGAAIIRQALERLQDGAQPEKIRAAAFAAKVRAAGPGGLDLVLEALRGQDAAMLKGAFSALREENGARLRMWHQPIMRAYDTMAATGRDGLLDIYVAADIRAGAGIAMRMINDETPSRRDALRALGQRFRARLDVLLSGWSARRRDRAAAYGLASSCASTGGWLMALLPAVLTESLPAVTDAGAAGTRSARARCCPGERMRNRQGRQKVAIMSARYPGWK